MKFVFVYFSFSTQKVKIVIKKQVHIHLNFINPKIKIIRDFRVFILSPIPKNENPKITEILQKRHNTEIWQCGFKNSADILQVT